MASRPFYVILTVTLASGGEDTMTYEVGAGNTLTIHDIRQKTSGAANIHSIEDEFGNKFGNMSQNKPLDINYYPDIATDNNNNSLLVNPIVIKPNGSIKVTVKDTSAGANTIFMYLEGFLDN